MEGAEDLLAQYRGVMESTLQIPDSRFLELKYQFRQKLWVSRQLDQDTGKTPNQLRGEYTDGQAAAERQRFPERQNRTRD